MKSLRADLAASAREERQPETGAPRSEDPRTTSREQLHRADAIVNDFRGRVRAELRTHVARGGVLDASVVDDFAARVENTIRELRSALTR